MSAQLPLQGPVKECEALLCEKPADGRYCSGHAHRLRKHEWLYASTKPTEAQLLWRHIRRQPSGCWLWVGAINHGGYGVANRWNGGTPLAHRRVYELLVEPIPDGLDLDHLCRNRACVNPSHLEPVTRAVNLRRGIESRLPERLQCPRGHERERFPDGVLRCRVCRNEPRRLGQRTFTCKVCASDFEASRADAAYCSPLCKGRAQNARRRSVA